MPSISKQTSSDFGYQTYCLKRVNLGFTTAYPTWNIHDFYAIFLVYTDILGLPIFLRNETLSSLFELDQKTACTLIGILTKHSAIDSFAYNPVPPHLIETVLVQHISCECPAFQNRRNRILGIRTFEDLAKVAYVPLRLLSGFIRSSVWFEPITNGL